MNAAIVRQDKLILKGSPLGEAGHFGTENPQPFFREPDADLACGSNFPEDKKYSYGRETGFRLLPYTMQDRYRRQLIDMGFPSIILENDFIKAEFIPGLGGRLWSLFDKKRNREILYRNPVFRPANLAIRDAWFSGGIEWNIGRVGHAVHTCSPVFAGILESRGETVLRLWEFERQTRLFWRVEFSLPEDSGVLFAYTRIENQDDNTKPLYWWTNTAIPQKPGVRIFSATSEVIYIVPGTGKVRTMDCGHLPDLPVLPGKDASYPAMFDYSNEYFFQNDRVCTRDFPPWQAAVYEDGFTYGEISTAPLLYRKMFCWGSGRGGGRWQDFLSMPGEEYLEVQAGLAPTQLHTGDISGGGIVDWVQAFTAFETEPEAAHQRDYASASKCVGKKLTEHIGKAVLENALDEARSRSSEPARILFFGSGWGFLETHVRRRACLCPPGLSFPDESIGEAEEPWAELLNTGLLPQRAPEAGPGSFADETWEALLETSPEQEKDWLTPYHLGVIAFERGDAEKAICYWKKSLAKKENIWALRNLAQAALKADAVKGIISALGYYKQALNHNKEAISDKSFQEEYIPLLLKAGRDEEAAAELTRCGPVETLSLPLLEAAAELALRQKDDALLDRIFSLEPAHIREGKTTLLDIWIEREIRRICDSGKNRKGAEKELQKMMLEEKLIPPREINFRMY